MAGGFSGDVSFIWKGDEIAAQIQAAIESAMDETGVVAVGVAKSLARVDTGEMRDSIAYTVERTQPAQLTLTLSVGTDHGLFNELGTSKMSAQPMIRPAADQEFPKLPQRINAPRLGV